MSKKNAAASRADRAAGAVRAQEREERRRRTIMIGGVVAVVLAILVVGYFVTRNADSTSDVAAPPAGSGEHGIVIGEPDAPHEVVIYEDFHCVHCATLEEATHAELAQLAEEGAAVVEYRPISFLTDYSERSTNALKVVLEESGPETAKAFHGLLFEHYDEASASEDGLDDDRLVELAVEAGADEDAVRPGIEDGTQADWVESATDAARDAGVSATPTVLLDGAVFQQGGTTEELADALLAELEQG